MLFLVKIEVSYPPDLPQSVRDHLRQQENARAHAHIESGRLKRIWRIVGTTANFGIWNADSLEQLHEMLTSLPLFPYVKMDVTPLIDHPVTIAWEEVRGAMPTF